MNPLKAALRRGVQVDGDVGQREVFQRTLSPVEVLLVAFVMHRLSVASEGKRRSGEWEKG